MTGRERYVAVMRGTRERHRKLYDKFLAGELDYLPDLGHEERKAIVAEMDVMQAEIERLYAVVNKTGYQTGPLPQRAHDILNGRIGGYDKGRLAQGIFDSGPLNTGLF